jgi:hypothetical protein
MAAGIRLRGLASPPKTGIGDLPSGGGARLAMTAAGRVCHGCCTIPVADGEQRVPVWRLQAPSSSGFGDASENRCIRC